VSIFAARNLAQPFAAQAGAFSPAMEDAASLLVPLPDPEAIVAPSAAVDMLADGAGPSLRLVSTDKPGFKSIVARELGDRKRRMENLRRFGPDVGVMLGATCAIAANGCDASTALTRVLVILGSAKAALYALGFACEVHDFRKGEKCISRRIYDWFNELKS
jgi:hypothetical protein